MSEHTALVPLAHVQHLLAEAHSLAEVKQLRDKAEAVRVYCQTQAHCESIVRHAAEIKARAERKLGLFLADLPREPGRRSDLTPSHAGTRLQNLPEGISRSQAHRWQQIAAVPEEDFERHLLQKKEAPEGITTRGLLELARKYARTRRQAPAADNDRESGPVFDLFELLDSGRKFSCVLVDPPWPSGDRGGGTARGDRSPGLSPEDLKTLPVGELARDQAHLHLWATDAFLFASRDLLEAWGFAFKGALVWVKPHMGPGNYYRLAHQYLLLGVRGGLPSRDRGQISWVHAERPPEGGTPEAVREVIERVSPPPYLELFGRRQAEGWLVWGNPVGGHGAGLAGSGPASTS